MRWKAREWILIGILLTAMTSAGLGQVTTTEVADTIYHADGTVAAGTIIISWPTFTTDSGESVPGGSTSAAIGAGGALSIRLAPNSGSNPMGSYYTAVYHLDDGSVSREYWVVPVSSSAVSVSAIRSTVLPTSVAMQTVSKNYVDTAIAIAVSGHPLDSTPYVLKAGDTMTGPLVLPADPVSANQAADKGYVDSSVASIAGGIGQKVSTLPTGPQTVAQPTGTQLDVNNLNGVEYANQYVSGGGSNGVANAVASSDCSTGCEVKVGRDYGAESYDGATWNSQTHVKDARGGAEHDTYFNPLDVVNHGQSSGQVIDVISTQTEASIFQQTGNQEPASVGLAIIHQGLAGGSNLFPETIENPIPYFKMGYSALTVNGVYNTQGQHGLIPQEIDCYGVGDCLMGSHFLYASGGFRDGADEGAHGFDLQTHEDARVFQGTCASGCSTGSTSLVVSANSGVGTQGDGRFLIDKNPAKVISDASTSGKLIGGTAGDPHPTAVFSGTSFPVSVFLRTAQVIPSQAGNQAPGTVNVAIMTTGTPAAFATSTAALGTSGGVACVTDQFDGYNPHDYEMATFTVVDATHLQMALNKPHQIFATISFGGLCGYGLEQTVDTANGIRQVFPVVGTYSPTALYYAGGTTAIVGGGSTSAYLNLSEAIATVARSGNTVSLTTVGNLLADVNGLTVTIAGVADGSYNGNYVVTTTGPNTLTYQQVGANSSSTGGTFSILTGGFALYPMAEVLSVFNQATKAVDGKMTLAANLVAWAPNDSLEEPHYYQELVAGDIQGIWQTTPRPTTTQRAGMQYNDNVGPGMVGWSIANQAPTTSYIGYGGTHNVPDVAYEAVGIWKRSMSLGAGEQAVFAIHCNLRGCGNWNSGYNLFELDSAVGVDVVSYSPQSSGLLLNLRGSNYLFTPQAFTAATINVGTLNATTMSGGSITTGTVAATRLPLFGPSGSSHSAGIVPDPGATTGSARFLREDGIWAATGGGGSGAASITSGTIDGTVIGGTSPAAVSATLLNGLPVSEYGNLTRRPMVTLLQALHNARNQAVNILVVADSFALCDYANCGAGPTISTNRWTEQLRINLQSQFGSHGTGMVPLTYAVGAHINPEVWSVAGSWDASTSTLGPVQGGGAPGSALIHLSNGAVATFTTAIPYDTINTYCMTTAASGSLAVTIDGVSVGTACGSTTSTPTAHAVTSSSRTSATHTASFTSTGDSYLYAAEGTNGTTGVSVHNIASGGATSQFFGAAPSAQLAFSDLIPTGTQGVITMLQTNDAAFGIGVSSFTSAMNAIITHEQALASAPSVLIAIPPADAVSGLAPYTSAQVAISQQQNVALVNVQDRWGSAYVSSSGLWDLGPTSPGIHPNDKGSLDEYSLIYAAMVDPVPFGASSSSSGFTLSTTGTSGAATYTSGVLNIPQYGGAGGCSSACTLSALTTLDAGAGSGTLGATPLNMVSSNTGGTYFTVGGAGSGVHNWGFHSQGSTAGSPGNFAIGDFTTGHYLSIGHQDGAANGFWSLGSNDGYCWSSNSEPSNASPDTCLWRNGSSGVVNLGNGTSGDASGSLSLSTASANLYKGPLTAPSGSCSAVGWAFSQDGHATFCNGTTWVTKI